MQSLYIAVQPVGSGFAKALQQALRAKVVNKIYRVDHQRAAYLTARHPRNECFQVTPQTRNKIEQFKAFGEAGVSCPKWSLTAQGVNGLGCTTVFARTLVNSTGGKGIVEIQVDPTGATQYVAAPLYTEYVPKKAEYRVHVFNGQVIDIQQKKKKREFNQDNRDTRVRNLANGYVYTREGVVAPPDLADLAVAAVRAVGYSYGAVDAIFNERRGACFVLEVNSRPGLMGTTLDKYTNALINQFNLTRKP